MIINFSYTKHLQIPIDIHLKLAQNDIKWEKKGNSGKKEAGDVNRTA